MARQGKKMAKKLARRVSAWESMPKATNVDAKGPNAKGTYHHKPGSNKK